MRRLLIILTLLTLYTHTFGQFKKQLDSLCVMCNNISSDSEKVIALGKLANLYYTYQLNRQGDSVLHDQLQVAEMSDNNNLILLALFSDAITNISESTTAESFDKAITFLQKGIEFAKSQNQNDYIALGYIRMAAILRKRGQIDKALYNASQALQLVPNVNSDSIKAVIYIELGNSYIARGEAVSAVRNYNNAFDIALKLKSIPLQCDIYHSFADMYFVFLNNKDIAGDFLKKSLRLDKEHQYFEGEIRDYYDLSRVTDERLYLDKAILLSDSLHNYKYLLKAKKLMLIYYMVVEKNSEKTLQYLDREPDVKESYLNAGNGIYDQLLGNIYYYSNKFDPALSYYKHAEYAFINNFDDKRSRDLFRQIATTYQALNNTADAIVYYLKTLFISKKINDAKAIVSVSGALSILYNRRGDYQQAYNYLSQSQTYSDSLEQLSKARDIALLDVERENHKHEDELQQQQQKFNSKRDAQYMLITVSISIVFILLLLIGTFPVSKLTIKMFGYFFFISLFEFIVMLIDNSFLAKMVHNEPFKLWLIKIVLIACLVPLQHFLEHNLIKFLASRKLIEARTKLSFKKLWRNIKKPADDTTAGIEEDAAVL